MKRKRQMLEYGFAIAAAVLLGVMAYVRLAPDDPSRWRQLPESFGAWGFVANQINGATLRLPSDGKPSRELLDRLDRIALATPRTTRIAGSLDEGYMVWRTRSLVWGFPDYTTAQARADGLYIHARLRFGRSDLGVNAARLKDWLARL